MHFIVLKVSRKPIFLCINPVPRKLTIPVIEHKIAEGKNWEFENFFGVLIVIE
jgi:hypothetical protein